MTRVKKAPDFLLLLSVVILLSAGLIMILSASGYSTLVEYGDSFYFFKRQVLWAVIGLLLMVTVMNIDYRYLKLLAPPALFLAFVLLIAVLMPAIGQEAYGSSRWISIGPLTFQPSELVKLCLVIFVAYGLAKRGTKIRNFVHGLLPFLLLVLAAAGLVLLQPDLGTAVTIAGTIVIMFFVAGAKISTLAALLGMGGVMVGVAIYMAPYRMQRFLTFLDPWADPQGAGFHIIQSLYALGSGGFFGTGLGQGKQKFLYLPAHHTDFIYAILGEELGFLGAAVVIGLFIVFLWRGLHIALAAPDRFGMLLAAGITSGITLQAAINIGVVTGSLPVTGITLPFISFGGTSLIFTLIGVGILLNISKNISGEETETSKNI